MVGFKINKSLSFFDSKVVMSATDKATRRVLGRFGAFVRRTAKSSIRKSKKSAVAGKPPRSHTGLLKKYIFFGYEPTTQSVIIGPTPLPSKDSATLLRIEEGGTTTITRRGRTTAARYAPRPFMGPAFEKEKPKVAQMWADQIR